MVEQTPDRNKHVEEWKCKQCSHSRVKCYTHPVEDTICDVLGEIFGGECRNVQGELCRYYYNLGDK